MKHRFLRCSKCKKPLSYMGNGACECGGIIEQYFTITNETSSLDSEELMAHHVVGLNVSPTDEVCMKEALELCNRLYELNKHRCVWVSFDGYDEDSREVWEIPECISWAKRLLDTLGKQKMAVLGDDLNREGLGLGLIGMHVVAGYGAYEKKSDGHYSFGVPDLVLKSIIDVHEIKKGLPQ